MKLLNLVLGLVLLGSGSLVSSANAADPATIRQIVGQTVALYRGDGYLRYNQHIDLNFIEKDELNAYATWDPSGRISVNFFQKLLASFTEDEVQVVVCHELGHLLGDMPVSKIGYRPAVGIQDPLSVEGEADYFAGKCMVGYLMEMEGFDLQGAQDKTFVAALGVFSKLYEVEANAQAAEGKKFRGVNDTYPDPNCRTLSVWNGAEGLKRPACWYNPAQ